MWLPTHYIICIDDWFKLKLGKAEKVRYFLIWNLFRWNPCRRLLTTRSCTTPCATSSPSQSKKSSRSSSGFHLIFSGLVKVSLFSGGTKPSLDRRSVSTLRAVSLSAFRPVCWGWPVCHCPSLWVSNVICYMLHMLEMCVCVLIFLNKIVEKNIPWTLKLLFCINFMLKKPCLKFPKSAI